VKLFVRVFVCLAVIAFSLNALAAEKANITTAKDGIRISTCPVKSVAQDAKTPAVESAPESLAALYNNLAFDYRKAIYWCCYGGLLAGPNSTYGLEHGTAVWQATGFTPGTNMTVTSVKLGVAYQSGTFTDVIVTINADNGGIPGAVLSTFTVKKMPVFGSCCEVKTSSVKGGVAVTAGTPYWIVIGMEPTSDFQGSWNFDISDQVDAIPNAYLYDGVWYPFDANVNFSFGVYGQ
jgi:hypothetical protein